MGFTRAIEARRFLPRQAALAYHLGSNHYPPFPVSLVGICDQAIEYQDEPDRVLELPEGLAFRNGERTITVAKAIEVFHLEAFLGELEEELPEDDPDWDAGSSKSDIDPGRYDDPDADRDAGYPSKQEA